MWGPGMVRPADLRKRKYEGKVDPDTLAIQTRALKPLMVRQETEYFPAITTVEEKVKKLVEGEGVPSIQVRDYLNFGREMFELTRKFSGSTLAGEAQLRVNKWSVRGLAGTLLVKIAGLFGVEPSVAPGLVIPPQHQPDAFFQITPPSKGVRYVVLQETPNVRIIHIGAEVSWSAQCTLLSVFLTVDGQEHRFSVSNPASGTGYTALPNAVVPPNLQLLYTFNFGVYRAFLLEGRLAKVEVMIDGGTPLTMFCRVRWAKWP